MVGRSISRIRITQQRHVPTVSKSLCKVSLVKICAKNVVPWRGVNGWVGELDLGSIHIRWGVGNSSDVDNVVDMFLDNNWT